MNPIIEEMEKISREINSIMMTDDSYPSVLIDMEQLIRGLDGKHLLTLEPDEIGLRLNKEEAEIAFKSCLDCNERGFHSYHDGTKRVTKALPCKGIEGGCSLHNQLKEQLK